MNADSRAVPSDPPRGAPRPTPSLGPAPSFGIPGPEPASVSLRRRLAGPAAVFAAAAGAFGYVGAVDPNEPGHYPVCPLYLLTGLYCPGCGGLRSAHALVHGDVLTALRDNAAAVAAYLGCAVLWMVWTARAARGRPLRTGLGPARLWTGVVLLLAFTAVRNLPFGGWLRP